MIETEEVGREARKDIIGTYNYVSKGRDQKQDDMFREIENLLSPECDGEGVGCQRELVRCRQEPSHRGPLSCARYLPLTSPEHFSPVCTLLPVLGNWLLWTAAKASLILGRWQTVVFASSPSSPIMD